MKKEKLYLDDLKCSGCATTIRSTLASIEGVSGVVVRPNANLVLVEHDGSKGIALFMKRLSRLGYPGNELPHFFERESLIPVIPLLN